MTSADIKTAARSCPTPFYLYDMSLLSETISAVKAAAAAPEFKVHYAMKANAEMPILEAVRDAGFGVDTVSGGEIRRALECGFPAEKIVYAGVGKTDSEIDLGLQAGIGCFNVESIEELEIIAERSERLGIQANVALRVNPDIDAHTHHYITTGLAENKFGISLSMLDRAIDIANNSKWLRLNGIHFHIGSQITDLTPYKILCDRINTLLERLEDKGVTFKSINVGGGLGIDYDHPHENPLPDFKAYFNVFSRNLRLRPGQEVHFELGRSIVAQCGSLITKVIYVKKGIEKKFVIVDAGFTDLIRPALYQAVHKIDNVTSASKVTETYDIVGPICESSDVFVSEVSLPQTSRGDLLAILSAGAYGSVMAMQYNCRQLPGAVFLSQGNAL